MPHGWSEAHIFSDFLCMIWYGSIPCLRGTFVPTSREFFHLLGWVREKKDGTDEDLLGLTILHFVIREQVLLFSLLRDPTCQLVKLESLVIALAYAFRRFSKETFLSSSLIRLGPTIILDLDCKSTIVSTKTDTSSNGSFQDVSRHHQRIIRPSGT